MAKLISARYSKGQYAGQTLQFPVIGKATFDEKGHLEVDTDDEKLEAFILLTKDSFDFLTEAEFNKPSKPKATQKDLVGKLKKGKGQKDDYDEPTNDEDRELKELLEQADEKTLLEMAGEESVGLDPATAAAMSNEKLRRAVFHKLKAVPAK